MDKTLVVNRLALRELVHAVRAEVSRESPVSPSPSYFCLHKETATHASGKVCLLCGVSVEHRQFKPRRDPYVVDGQERTPDPDEPWDLGQMPERGDL